MICVDKRKREKEVELRDILQELKKQTFINFVLSAFVVFFTIDLFLYEVYKRYLIAAITGIILGAIILWYIRHKLKTNKINLP